MVVISRLLVSFVHYKSVSDIISEKEGLLNSSTILGNRCTSCFFSFSVELVFAAKVVFSEQLE